MRNKSNLLLENENLKMKIKIEKLKQKRLIMENENINEIIIIVNEGMKAGSDYHNVFYTLNNDLDNWVSIPTKYGYGDAFVTTIKEYFNENNVMDIPDDVYTKADLEGFLNDQNIKSDISKLDVGYENINNNIYDFDFERVTNNVTKLVGLDFDYDESTKIATMDAGDILINLLFSRAKHIDYANGVKVDIYENGELLNRDQFGIADSEKEAGEVISYSIKKNLGYL